jgi:hypothetical protein
MPSYFRVAPVVWQDAKGRDSISLVRMPVPMATLFTGSAINRAPSVLMRRMFKETLGARPAASHFSGRAVMLCGSQARVITMRMHGKPTQEIIFEDTGASGLIIGYSYAAEETESHFLHRFCPVPSADISTLSPPPGWRVKPEMHPIAGWFGPTMGEMLVESQGPLMPSLVAASSLGTSSTHTSTTHVGSSLVHATTRRVKQICGSPALEVEATIHLGTMRMLTHRIVVQSATSSYSIEYVTSETTSEPAVIAAMHAFCP